MLSKDKLMNALVGLLMGLIFGGAAVTLVMLVGIMPLSAILTMTVLLVAMYVTEPLMVFRRTFIAKREYYLRNVATANMTYEHASSRMNHLEKFSLTELAQIKQLQLHVADVFKGDEALERLANGPEAPNLALPPAPDRDIGQGQYL